VPSAPPSLIPSFSPTNVPSLESTLSVAPTKFGRIDIVFRYDIETQGVSGSEILSGEGNTVANDLIVATTTILIGILESITRHLSSPKGIPPYIEYISCCHNESKSKKYLLSDASLSERGLASFSEEFPIQIIEAIDINCLSPVLPGVNCVLIGSIITVFADSDEDPAKIEELVINGFLISFSDGSFKAALPT